MPVAEKKPLTTKDPKNDRKGRKEMACASSRESGLESHSANFKLLKACIIGPQSSAQI